MEEKVGFLAEFELQIVIKPGASLTDAQLHDRVDGLLRKIDLHLDKFEIDVKASKDAGPNTKIANCVGERYQKAYITRFVGGEPDEILREVLDEDIPEYDGKREIEDDQLELCINDIVLC